MRALAPPRQSGVLNKSLGFERPLSKARGFLKTLARTRADRISFAKLVPRSASRGELFLANVPEG
jgi:hypothetical protein